AAVGARGVRLRHPRFAPGHTRERRTRPGARQRRRGARREGSGHPEGSRPAGARPAVAHRRASARHRREQRRSGVGRFPLLPAVLWVLSPDAAPGRAGMTRRAHGVLWTLQATVLALPLFLGGRQPVGLVAAWLVISVLLVITIRARRHAEASAVPGAAVLAAFVGLGLITVLPLPPALLDRLAPARAQLYRDVLPAWPGGGGWSTWRSLSVDPYAVCTTLSTLAVGFGAYLVLAGYPWGDEDARARAFGRVLLAMLVAGAALSLIALFQ